MNEHEEQMTKVVKEIELQYATLLSEGVTPSVIIGTGRTFEMLFEFYCGGQPDWLDSIVKFSLDGSNEAAMTVYRTIDLEHGILIIK
jgi:hypothetical protein